MQSDKSPWIGEQAWLTGVFFNMLAFHLLERSPLLAALDLLAGLGAFVWAANGRMTNTWDFLRISAAWTLTIPVGGALAWLLEAVAPALEWGPRQ